MTTQNHTPGPWTATRRAGISVQGPDGRSVCSIPATVQRPRDESDANGRLIAAAPDLLDAIRRLLAICPRPEPVPVGAKYSMDREYQRGLGEAIAAASAAIAKAQGQGIAE